MPSDLSRDESEGNIQVCAVIESPSGGIQTALTIPVNVTPGSTGSFSAS